MSSQKTYIPFDLDITNAIHLANQFYPLIKQIQECVNVLLSLEMTDKVCHLCDSRDNFETYISQLNKLYNKSTSLLMHTNQIMGSDKNNKKMNRLIRELKSRKTNRYECIGVLLNIEYILNQLQSILPILQNLITELNTKSICVNSILIATEGISGVNKQINDQINSDKLAIENYFFEMLTCDIKDGVQCLLDKSNQSKDMLNEML